MGTDQFAWVFAWVVANLDSLMKWVVLIGGFLPLLVLSAVSHIATDTAGPIPK
jgi:hypothetical protein